MTDIRIPLAGPNLGAREAARVRECIDSTFASSVGPLVNVFEEAFAGFVGARHAIACSSGTAAIHLALLALGVDGGEVWVSDLTFVASANPARYCGAEVTLVDSEDETGNLDPVVAVAELERRAAAGLPLPRAIVAVHLLGHPARLEPLLGAAERFDVPIIEDAAEALGATWAAGTLAGRHAGTVGRIGCFSFNGNKVMTTGAGGMVVTDDERLAAVVRHLSTQARIPGTDYEHDVVGYNYRLASLNAAVGLAQLERLPAFLDRKRAIADRYRIAFETVDEVIEGPVTTDWASSSYWLATVRFSNERTRQLVRAALCDEGIEARPIWPPLRNQAPYRGARVLGDETAARVASCSLSLPSSTGLTDGEQAEVVAGVTAAVRSVGVR